MKKERKRKLLILSLVTILGTTGCAKEEPKEISENTITTTIEEETDLDITSYFKEKEIELSEEDAVKEDIIEHTKTAVDFIYNDKPINNIYFSELKEEAKLEILESIEVTNEILERTGIKEITIVEGGKLITYSTELLKEGLEISKIALKELLDEETYNKASEIKEEASERLDNAIDEVKKYLKNRK